MVLGAGGGAWNYLYRQYQSYNYSSSQAHNYPLQLGIETGAIGIITLICLVVALVITYLGIIENYTSIMIQTHIILKQQLSLQL